MNIADLILRVDQLIEIGKTVQSTRHNSAGYEMVSSPKMLGFRSLCLSFIQRVYSDKHIHYKHFSDRTNSHYYGDSERAIAILDAIKNELEGGWLFQIKSLVTAEVFCNFLEQAEHLLSLGYKDAAAVMIGGVLEEHLKQLCKDHQLDINDIKDGKAIPRKADRLNSELTRTSAYNALDAKNITAWLGLRNDAAHGNYSAYTDQQVRNLYSGVLDFMARVQT